MVAFLHSLLLGLVVSIAAVKPALEGLRFGIHTHFTAGKPGQVRQLSEAFRVARQDFTWSIVEQVPGVYNFSVFDALFADLNANGVRPYWILCYGNPLYDNGGPPRSQQALTAYANFAVAAMDHFRNKSVIWELWNEPNGSGFWPPSPNATEYARLIAAVGKELAKRQDLRETEAVVGPALSGMDFKYLEAVLDLGGLEVLDAVSVHPYRIGGPESVLSDYGTLRTIIANHTGNGTTPPPVLSGEWGWSTCFNSTTQLPIVCHGGAHTGLSTPHDQAKLVARQYAVNAAAGIPVSVVYDLVNDGTDSEQGEMNFGTLLPRYYNESVPFLPKPAFQAASYFQQQVALPFLVRPQQMPPAEFVQTGNVSHFAVRFRNATHKAYSVWKIDSQPLPCSDKSVRQDCSNGGNPSQKECEDRGCCFELPYVGPGPQCYHPAASNASGVVVIATPDFDCYVLVDVLGRSGQEICPKNGLLAVPTSDAPVYLLPTTKNRN
eukprot:TRINITY_DN16010_c0_g1_i1.p1 TRINITY_DN16010_c0_g1~~TRINITY_DN16010_c0_g1_i1.p1  ORF type:complete len:499 (+),score=46.89 TRINITY_DN16010_c0_g1_i1:23-1498(+)